MNWVLECLKKYAVFSGRAQRAEYWYFSLFYTLILIGLAIVDIATGLFSLELGIGVLSGIFALIMTMPILAVSVRRLHDTGRSGWWLLIALIPLAGIVLLIFTVQDGTPGENKYGPNPKTVA
jgi:uncharacterized membrane protein YhaH (DUF805 family)